MTDRTEGTGFTSAPSGTGARPFRSVLVANRGEVAVRVIRACRALGLRSVAVYSEADAGALHVEMADEAVGIGPAPALSSYLDANALLAAARATGAEAVHPGFGFLSENARFARAVVEAGLVWVGPPPSAIEAMGLKVAARERMKAAGVPVVPGSHATGAGTDGGFLDPESVRRIGFPCVVKASAGGGGKGMRVVRDAASLDSAVASCRREAEAAFGDATVYVERYLERPRHVEVQLVADAHGNVASLGERDCSLQRRHQKVIEECPSPAVGPELRRRLSEAATAAARAVGYVGAGTVEFLLEASGEFHFLEMNTRLQVEHPVTEEAWGVDIVALQLAVAAGEPLPQLPSSPTAFAMEARLYAEDPEGGFLPQTGRVLRLVLPSGPGVRVDAGIAEGTEISVHYDPMLAKVIARGSSREEARRRLALALSETVVLGVTTNAGWLRRVLDLPEFVRGEADTSFLERAEVPPAPAPPPEAWAAAAALLSAPAGGAFRRGDAGPGRLEDPFDRPFRAGGVRP